MMTPIFIGSPVMMARSARRPLWSVACVTVVILLSHLAAASRPLDFIENLSIEANKPKHRFKTPKGLFIQERASKQLPGPGQHFSFGALKTWEEIHAVLDDTPDAKLLLLVRHGQAISNWLGDTVGPDIWYDAEKKCTYTNDNGTTYGVFDAELTDLGISEAQALNGMLDSSKWFEKLSGGKKASALVSPLSRCLQTSLLVLDHLPLTKIQVEENLRETLGEDTTDARRSKSNPDSKHPEHLQGPCDFKDGLAKYFPQFKFPIVDEQQRKLVRQGLNKGKDKPSGLGLGLLSDKDLMWTTEREGQKHQVQRAENFLLDVFEYIEERVLVVITHSGTVRSILLAAGREPYRPQNTELVPLLIVPAHLHEGQRQELQK